MRKNIMILVFVFLGILLTGCDLLNDEVIDDIINDIAELDCTVDTENELCKLIPSEGIEKAKIYALIASILENDFTSEEIKDTCFSIIAPARKKLVEDCIDGSFIFFSDEVTGFYPISFNSEGDTYTVVGSTDVEREELTITLSVILIEDEYKILEWSITSEIIPEEVLDAGFVTDEVLVMFENYLDDYMDLDISSEDLVWTYFRAENDDMYDDYRLDEVNSLLSIEFSHIVKRTESTFEVFYIIETSEEFINIGQAITVMEDELGLYFLITEIVPWLDYVCDDVTQDCSLYKLRDVNSMFINYLDDYMNLDISSEDLVWNYFRAENDAMYDDYRLNEVNSLLSIEFSHSIKREESSFEVFYIIDTGEEFLNIGQAITVMEDDLGLYFLVTEIVPWEDIPCDEATQDCSIYKKTDVEEMFENYLDDYMNLDIRSEALVWDYFRSENDAMYEDLRNNDVLTLESMTFSHLLKKSDTTYEVFAIANKDEELQYFGYLITVMEDYEGLYFRITDSVPWKNFECDSVFTECLSINIEDVEELFIQYLEDYMNDDISTEDLMQHYFRVEADTVDDELRLEDIFSGAELLFSHIIKYESGTFDVFHIVEDGSKIKKSGTHLYIMEDEDGLYFNFVHSVDWICNDATEDCTVYPSEFEVSVIEDLYSSYLLDYVNKGIHADEIKWMYHRELPNIEYTLSRISELDLIDTVEFFEIYAVTGNTFEVFEKQYIDNQEKYIGYLISVTEDKDGIYFRRLHSIDYTGYICDDEIEDCPIDPVYFETDEVAEIFEYYLDDYMNLDISSEDLVWAYFRAESDDMYDDYRLDEVTSFLSIEFSHIIKRAESTFEVFYIVDTGEELLNIGQAITVMADDQGLYFVVTEIVPWLDYVCDDLTQDCGIYRIKDVSNMYSQYLKDYLNNEIPGNDLLWNYFRATYEPMFESLRQEEMESVLDMSLSHIVKRTEDSFEVYSYYILEHEVVELSFLISVLEDEEGLYFIPLEAIPWQDEG